MAKPFRQAAKGAGAEEVVDRLSSKKLADEPMEFGAWQGGPCPQCGDVMPARVVHCMSCRALLNSELTEDSIEIPAFEPLQEIVTDTTIVTVGHYVACPGCQEELRIHSKYRGMKVQCRHCSQPFVYDNTVLVHAIYSACPHCSQEVRAATKYLGKRVACKHCDGALQLPSQI